MGWPGLGSYDGAVALAHVPGVGSGDPIGTHENMDTPNKTTNVSKKGVDKFACQVFG